MKAALRLTPPTRNELSADAFFDDPYPFYARLRAAAGPYWLPHTQDTSLGGLWLFSRYADGEQLFKQTQGISKNLAAVRAPGTGSVFDLHLLHRDGTDHLRLRRLVAGHFAPAAMPRLARIVQEEADILLGAMATNQRCDLVAQFAEPLPLAVVARWIGVPREHMPQVRAWSVDLADGFDSLRANPEVLARQRLSLAAFLAYAEQRLHEVERTSDDSLLSHLAGARAAGQIAHEEVVAMLGFLLFAGHETTVSLIGSALWLLATHPTQQQALRNEPGLMASAVEEVLRFESPEQRTSFRIVREPLDIGGVRLEPGQQVGAIIGSLNRDPAVFPDADHFDIRRAPNRHLAFGVGLHHCQGKAMARTQAAVAIERLLRRFPRLTADGDPRWRRNSFFRSLQTLPVRTGLLLNRAD